MDMLMELLIALWVIMPAYAANLFPPFARGKIPIDGGRKVKEWRILGDGKTWEGFLIGLFVGVLVGLAEAYLRVPIESVYGLQLPQITVITAVLIPLGALLGDLAGSFIKRRFRMPRGADAPFLDQLDFLMGALLLSYWFLDITAVTILIMFVITPVLHRLSSIVGFWLKLKREPW